MKENPGECECCGFETDDLRLYEDMPGGLHDAFGDFWYCDLCATSQTSTYSRYPSAQASNLAVMQAICLVGNKIIDEIAKPRRVVYVGRGNGGIIYDHCRALDVDTEEPET